MNKLEIGWNKSIFSIYQGEYRELRIDGEFTVNLVSKMYQEDDFFKGLVPAYSGWLMNDDEEQLVFDRLLPQSNAICPILICPDDQDFSCTVVVVEIIKKPESILWKRIGRVFHNHNHDNTDILGETIAWRGKNINKEFEFIEYESIINKLKAARNEN
jgi:hypothetical protein